MADASVVIDTKIEAGPFQKGLDDLNKAAKTGFEKMGATISQSLGMTDIAFGTMIGNMAGKLVAGIVAGAGKFITDSIDLASDLSEVQNVVDTTFENGAESINQWAKAAKESYGMSELKAKQYLSTTGAMLKSSGITGASIVQMAEGVTGLAGDMASFYNLDHQTAFEKIRSGISGETEPLKQLGINMSVANLESFALSQGITKSYNSMTQAEQVTLRYNYLLQATADAQGDFAATSESQANQQRILDTTMEELSATVGSIFLPLATRLTKALVDIANGAKSVVGWFKDLFDPPKSELEQQITDAMTLVNDFNGSVSRAGQTLHTSLESTKQSRALAESLLSSYDRILAKNVLTEEDTAQLRTIASQIVALYPSMGAYLDSTSGLFNENTTSIRKYINAMADMKKADAYYAAMQSYSEALLKSTVTQATAFDAYNKAYTDWQDKLTKATSANALRDALTAKAYDTSALEMYAGQLMAISPTFGKYYELVDGAYKVTAEYANSTYTAAEVSRLLNTYVADYNGLAYVANERTVKLGTAYESTTKAAADAAEQHDVAEESYKKVADTIGYTTQVTEGQNKATGDLVKTIGSLPGGLSRIGKASQVELDALRKKILEVTNATRQSIDANVSGFDKADKVRTQSAKKTLANLKSQAEYLKTYQENYAKAKEKGVSDEVLKQLSDGSAESAKVLAGLATATDAQIADVNAIQTEISAQKTAMAETLAAEQLSLSTAQITAQGVLDAANAAVAGQATTTEDTITKAAETGTADAEKVSAASTAVATATADIKTNRATVKTEAEGIVTDVGGALDDGADTLAQAGSDAITKVAGGIKGNKKATTAAGDMANRALAAIRSYFNAFETVGYNVVSHMATGVTTGQSVLTTAIRQVVAAALAAAANAGYGGTPDTGENNGNNSSEDPEKRGSTFNENNSRSLGISMPTILSEIQAQYIIQASVAETPRPSIVYQNTQHITFAGDIQSPDAVARKVRSIRLYGLEALRS